MEKRQENQFRNGKATQIAYFKAYTDHIHNPGMGIISMAVSDHMVQGYTESERAEADRKPPFQLTRDMLQEVTAIPYIDNIYIRVGWKDVQQEKGKITLSPAFEMAMEEAKKAGKSWGFRVMQCSPSNPDKHLIPKFLEDKLPMVEMYDDGTYGPKPKLMPACTDEYLKYWEEMLYLLGEKLDKDASLEYADVSGFGYWGEGHSSELSSREEENAFIGKLLDCHDRAFVKTPMVMNLHLSEFYTAGQKYLEKGSWVRRDSYYGWFNPAQAQDGRNRRKDAAMIFETIMPGLITKDDKDPSFRHHFLDTADSMCDYGANYATVGFNPMDTLYAAHMVPQVYTPFSKRLGYRLRPSIVWKYVEGEETSLVLGMVNDGCANPPGEVTFVAESNGKMTEQTVNGGKFGEGMIFVKLPLAKDHNNQVKLKLKLKMKGKEFPVRFAADTGIGEAPLELYLNLDH